MWLVCAPPPPFRSTARAAGRRGAEEASSSSKARLGGARPQAAETRRREAEGQAEQASRFTKRISASYYSASPSLGRSAARQLPAAPPPAHAPPCSSVRSPACTRAWLRSLAALLLLLLRTPLPLPRLRDRHHQRRRPWARTGRARARTLAASTASASGARGGWAGSARRTGAQQAGAHCALNGTSLSLSSCLCSSFLYALAPPGTHTHTYTHIHHIHIHARLKAPCCSSPMPHVAVPLHDIRSQPSPP